MIHLALLSLAAWVVIATLTDPYFWRYWLEIDR